IGACSSWTSNAGSPTGLDDAFHHSHIPWNDLGMAVAGSVLSVSRAINSFFDNWSHDVLLHTYFGAINAESASRGHNTWTNRARHHPRGGIGGRNMFGIEILLQSWSSTEEFRASSRRWGGALFLLRRILACLAQAHGVDAESRDPKFYRGHALARIVRS